MKEIKFIRGKSEPKEGEQVIVLSERNSAYACQYADGKFHFGGGTLADHLVDRFVTLPDYIPEPVVEVPIRKGPSVINDIPAYECPVTGKMVTSRKQRREIIREHNLIEVGNEKPPQLRD